MTDDLTEQPGAAVELPNIMVTPLGVALRRPSERVLELLPSPQRGAFAKEDGELVIDAAGKRVSAAT